MPQDRRSSGVKGNGPRISGSLSQRLACIRGNEQDQDGYRSVSDSGRYRGAYQFDRQTFAEFGGSGDPAKASPAEQDRVAANVIRKEGVRPGRWPTPARRGC